MSEVNEAALNMAAQKQWERNQCGEAIAGSAMGLSGHPVMPPSLDYSKVTAEWHEAEARANHCGNRADKLQKESYVQREAERYWRNLASQLRAVFNG